METISVQTAPTPSTADAIDAAAESDAHLGTIEAKKARRKKKPKRTTTAATLSATVAVTATEFVPPLSMEEAGGWDKTSIFLLEHGILQNYQTDQLCDSSFRFQLNALPLYTVGKHKNFWELTMDFMKSWLFLGEIVHINQYSSTEIEFILKDDTGTICGWFVNENVQHDELYSVGKTLCVYAPFYRLREDSAEDGVLWALHTSQSLRQVIDLPVREIDEKCAQLYRNICWNCEERGIANSRCGACGSATYCSRDCQVKHWPTHKRRYCKGNTDLPIACIGWPDICCSVDGNASDDFGGYHGLRSCC